MCAIHTEYREIFDRFPSVCILPKIRCESTKSGALMIESSEVPSEIRWDLKHSNLKVTHPMQETTRNPSN